MANVPNITVDEMKEKAAALQADFESIEAELESKLSHGPAAAQSARLVAFALAKQTYPIFENLAGVLAYMSRSEVPVDDGGLFSSLVTVADDLVEAMVDQFDVEEAAIAPYVYEVNAIFIVVVEDLMAKAKAKLAEASALERAIDSTCVEVKE